MTLPPSFVQQGPCEHCGAHGARTTVYVGATAWEACETCVPLMRAAVLGDERPALPFGVDLADLGAPRTSIAYWGTYRLACARVGYTWLTALNRAERDRLHETEMQLASEGLVAREVADRPRHDFFVSPYREFLSLTYGSTTLTDTEKAYIKQLEDQGNPDCRTRGVKTNIVVPKRGALSARHT